MKYCKECGHPLKKGASFCSECGTSIETNLDNPRTNSSSTSTANPNHVPKKKWTKKQKVVAISTSIAIILLLIGYQIGSTLTDKNRIIENFGEAILDEDNDKLSTMLHSKDSRLEIATDDIDHLLDYLNDNPSYYNFVMDSLKKQADSYENGETNNFDDSVFFLEKEGKTAFLFDRYQINIVPFYFNVATNMEDAKILLNGEEIATADSDSYELEYGPVLPGVYELKSEYSDEFAMLENSYDLELMNPSNQNSYAELPLYGENVKLSSNFEDIASNVTYYVNDTEIQFNESDDNQFGPVSLDGSITSYATLQFPWGEVETEKITIEDNSVYFVADSVLETIKSDVMDAIHTHAQDWSDAYNDLDNSLFSNVTDPLLEVYTEDISDIKSNEKKWVGSYDKSIIDLDSFDLSLKEDTYMAYVDASLYFNSTIVDVEEDDVATTENHYDREYEFIYDNESSSWLINNYNNLFWGFNADNVQELSATEE
ncbi:zinc-ribbon domain-containing protein [Oceanobacillus limi]|uniref:Zinc-ribbon domain-containing protein n=1 Tax=Oceanobacillus limi TaxID=930131 RepID=A0A1I0AAQ2_9BACI|nr:zinc-ribbon domain-containing protein [Oceanobacillus limi]SES90336.1 zinc-ribbon domain-containing protein [Oceanobacillus limi]